MRYFRAFLFLLLVAPTPSCDKSDDAASENDGAKKTKKKKKSEKPEPTATKKTDPSAWKFVREQPQEREGVDACAYLGGLGMACLDALIAQTDPVKQRYMRLLSDADARIAQDALDKGEPGGVAHAEAAMFCADSGPCKQKNENGDELDDGYSCLTKAESALHEKDAATSSAAHKRACECDPVRAQIPVMGGTLACGGPNKLENRGSAIASLERAKAIRDCATCEPTRGPAACASEIDELKESAPELAGYLEKQHVPACQAE